MASAARILLINPNTSESVTERLAAEARRVAPPGVHIQAVTAREGVSAIQTPDELAAAVPGVLAALKANADCDAAIIGAFGDPGLDEARAAAEIPVVGLGEAGMLAAGANGRRFSILTVGEVMRQAITDKIAQLGLTLQLASLRFLPHAVADVVRDRASLVSAIIGAIDDCAKRDRAQAVLLGGGPFVGLASELGRRTTVPVLDGLHAALTMACASRDATRTCAGSPRGITDHRDS
jgi:allantoin racemase